MLSKSLLLISFILITVILADAFKMLTRSGAISAFFLAIFIAIGFNFSGLLVIGVFFLTSSLISKFGRARKAALDDLLANDDIRNWEQVFANGLGASFFALLYFYFPEDFILLAFLVVIASSTADTWASELGVLSRGRPISIKTFTRVPPGTSGAISILGTISALLGSSLIALVGVILFHEVDLKMFLYVSFFGFLGNLIDTFIGAFSQVKYCCEKCAIITEREEHCGQPTVRYSGNIFINNEVVNFLMSFLAGVLALLTYYIFN